MGVPLRTPVLALNVTPFGKLPVMLSVGVGLPEAVTVKVPDVPTVNVAVAALVTAGGMELGFGRASANPW